MHEWLKKNTHVAYWILTVVWLIMLLVNVYTLFIRDK